MATCRSFITVVCFEWINLNWTSAETPGQALPAQPLCLSSARWWRAAWNKWPKKWVGLMSWSCRHFFDPEVERGVAKRTAKSPPRLKALKVCNLTIFMSYPVYDTFDSWGVLGLTTWRGETLRKCDIYYIFRQHSWYGHGFDFRIQNAEIFTSFEHTIYRGIINFIAVVLKLQAWCLRGGPHRSRGRGLPSVWRDCFEIRKRTGAVSKICWGNSRFSKPFSALHWNAPRMIQICGRNRPVLVTARICRSGRRLEHGGTAASHCWRYDAPPLDAKNHEIDWTSPQNTENLWEKTRNQDEKA